MELTSHDLQFLLWDERIRLDCSSGRNIANTLIIVSLGGGRLMTYCHSCYG